MPARPHTPTRTCVACRSRLAKYQQRRYVMTDNKVAYDKHYTSAGRGVYVCSENCYDKVQNRLGAILNSNQKKTRKKP